MEENQIINQNAEGQEQAPVATEATETATATTNEPAAESQVETGVENTEILEPVNEVKIEEPVEEKLAAHDDFDWSIDKRNVASYTNDEKEKYDKVYDNTFVQINDGELIKGIVVGITKTDVVLNIVLKVMALFL